MSIDLSHSWPLRILEAIRAFAEAGDLASAEEVYERPVAFRWVPRMCRAPGPRPLCSREGSQAALEARSPCGAMRGVRGFSAWQLVQEMKRAVVLAGTDVVQKDQVVLPKLLESFVTRAKQLRYDTVEVCRSSHTRHKHNKEKKSMYTLLIIMTYNIIA